MLNNKIICKENGHNLKGYQITVMFLFYYKSKKLKEEVVYMSIKRNFLQVYFWFKFYL